MQKIVSSATGYVYRGVVKPLLFRVPPDKAHDHMLERAEFLNRHATLRALLRRTYRYEADNLQQTLHGIQFPNPIGLSAGLDKNCQLPIMAEMIGMGMIEVGSMTAQPCQGNERPWFHRLPRSKSLVVYAGLANQGVEANISTLTSYPASLWQNIVLNVSVAKTNCLATATDSAGIEDYCQGLQRVKDSGLAKIITINISCPNTFGGEPFTDPKRLRKLLQRVEKLSLQSPVFVKMPIDKPWEEFNALLRVLSDFSVAGVTIGNLAKDRTALTLRDELDPSVKGGLSGKPTWELSNHLIEQTYRKYNDRFTIIGVGGIFNGQDAWYKLTLGAHVLEMITGLIYEGPQVVGAINRYISERLRREGKELSDIIGSAVRK